MNPTLMQGVIRLVEDAGQAILPFWRQGVAVQNKADDSPVTAADLAAHRVLDQGLRALAPEIAVLSEEAADIALAERQGWSRWWLVDPLDGTKEFIADSEEFTVNVALVENGKVLFGVVGVPATGVCYYGGEGLGAWRKDAAGVQPIQVREQPATDFVLVASKRHSSPAQEQLLQGLESAFKVQLANVGSSLKFCLVAEGKADFYPRLAPTSQWDTAAAQGVLEGAGGVVLDLDGQSFAYAARESLLNPSFIALPKAAVWREQALSLLPPSA